MGTRAACVGVVVWALGGWLAAAWAQADAAASQRVEVLGTSADTGHEPSAGRWTLTREEILRHGDGSLADVLRRVPGLSITATAGRGSELRLRGLGNGYTQLLVNGEPAPPGFNIDTLSPAEVERIEVLQLARVDLAAQAIAGTVNIVLRRATRRPVHEYKLLQSFTGSLPATQLDGFWSDRDGPVSYSLTANAQRRQEAWPRRIVQTGRDASGQTLLERITERQASGRSSGGSLLPRLSWQALPASRLNLEATLRDTRFMDHSSDERQARLGPPPEFVHDSLRTTLHTRLAQWRLHGSHRLEQQSELDFRLGGQQLHRQSQAQFEGRDTQQGLALDEQIDSTTDERGLVAALKWRLPYSRGHALALGVDADRNLRDDQRLQRQRSSTGRPVSDLDEQFQARVQRQALYAQDEWDIDDRLSLYAGLRWARLGTRTHGQGMSPVGQQAAVTSPVLQLSWKPPSDTSASAAGDSALSGRVALGRSWRPPRTVDLLPRRQVAVDNTATTPDLQGNPALRPELAWGLDLSADWSQAQGAWALGVQASARRVRDVILERLSQDTRGWVSTRVNDGTARIASLELNARGDWRKSWPEAPDLRWRASWTRNWSRVEAVPGPDNHLDGQLPMNAQWGLDHQLRGLPLTWSVSLAVQGRARNRVSASETNSSNIRRVLDLALAWTLAPGVQLRLAAANVLRPLEQTTETYADAAGSLVQHTELPKDRSIRLGLDWRL